MTASYLRRFVLPAAAELLPPAMANDSATALLLAIGHQESRLTLRRQMGGGPARGLWQFELGGVSGVLSHAATRMPVRAALQALGYPYQPTPVGCQMALEHNDVLACCFARLLLWTLPVPLPTQGDPAAGWSAYTSAWRPGKPRPEAWPESWAIGWQA